MRNLAKHPNFGGELMVVGLGCEKFTVEMLLDEADISPENVIILQEKKGFDDMIEALMEMAEKKLQKLNERKRKTLPLSDLLIGMQCGGSDAFSGVTANPSAGYAADMLVKGGATVLFSEVTEVRDGVYLLGQRCVNEEVGKKLAAEMKWYDNYLLNGEVDRSANPTPGNKKGGLSNIVEKAWVPLPSPVRLLLWRFCLRLRSLLKRVLSMRPPLPAILSAAPASWPAESACRCL